MSDADVIPIGTRGRPGRGTGKTASSAARSLAGNAASAKPGDGTQEAGKTSAPRKGAQKKTQPKPGKKSAAKKPAAQQQPPEHDVTDGEVGVRDLGAHQSTPQADVPPQADAVRERGIPVSALWSAVQGAAREHFGEQWEPRLAQLLAFVRRRLTGDYEVDEFGFDPDVTQQFFLSALRPIAEHWFRVEVRGAENIPAEGGALVVSNHSGTVPVDGLMTGLAVNDHAGRSLRPLGADLVFKLPVVSSVARKAGATLACNEDAERMLAGGELVGVWPEGFKGIGKPFSERYKLQRFGRGGFVSAAVRTGVPIIPVSVVGAEEIYPLVADMPSLARLLGLPYIPITPLFPLLGPLGMVPLPSKWIIEFGEPIRTDEYEVGAADDPMLVFEVTDQVRETIQQTLYSLLMQRRSVFF